MRLIDADALLRDLNNRNIPFNADVNEAIIFAPTVDPYKHGHDTGEDRYFHCSVCGYGVADVYESRNSKVYVFEKQKNWKYCPHCGAKMDEVKE